MKFLSLFSMFASSVQGRIFRSIDELAGNGNPQLDESPSVKIVYPEGPFSLVAHAYNERDGAVWRVKDRENREYDLKVFMINANRNEADRKRRAEEFSKEKARMLKLGKLQCPGLASPVEGQELECTDRHVQIALASDVQVVDEKTGSLMSPEMPLQIPNGRGKLRSRKVIFGSNILFEEMPGGILSKVLKTKVQSGNKGKIVRKFSTFVHRYPLFVSVAPQMVDALRFLHGQGFVHLSMDASSVLCKDSLCKRAVLTDLTTSWDGRGKNPVEAHESMQPAVRFAIFYGRGAFDDKWPSEKILKTVALAPANMSVADFEKNDTLRDAAKVEEEVLFNPLLSVNPVSFKEARSIDWYALGGTLFYIMTGQRPMVDDFKDTSKSKLGMGTDTAEFVHSSLLSLFSGNKNGKLFKAVEKHVTEAMLLVDGLLQESRKNRISFDSDVIHADKMASGEFNLLPKRLRRSSDSLLQMDTKEAPLVEDHEGKSCANFVYTVGKQEFNIESPAKSLPPFMANICRV